MLAIRPAIVMDGDLDVLKPFPSVARLALASLANDLGGEATKASPAERIQLRTALFEIEPAADDSGVVALADMRAREDWPEDEGDGPAA